MRSWLFVPGNQARMLRKAQAFRADALILDLEDSVPFTRKGDARELVAATIKQSTANHFLCVRVTTNTDNSLADDLAAVVQKKLSAIVLPKVESAEDLVRADRLLARFEANAGLPKKQILLFATIETSRGLIAAAGIASGNDRLAGLLFGAEDFAVDLGLGGGGNSDEMLYARSAIATAAASGGIMAIDRVVTDFRNSDYLVTDTRQASGLGFRGKAVIHPLQIDIVNEIFTPGPEELVQAKRVVDEYERGVQTGMGAIQVDGEMIDAPVVERARRVIARGEAARCKQSPKTPESP